MICWLYHRRCCHKGIPSGRVVCCMLQETASVRSLLTSKPPPAKHTPAQAKHNVPTTEKKPPVSKPNHAPPSKAPPAQAKPKVPTEPAPAKPKEAPPAKRSPPQAQQKPPAKPKTPAKPAPTKHPQPGARRYIPTPVILMVSISVEQSKSYKVPTHTEPCVSISMTEVMMFSRQICVPECCTRNIVQRSDSQESAWPV